MPDTAQFETLLAEGLAVDVEARWGAGFLAGRYVPGEPSWNWPQIARPHLADAERLLDMGTGDGGQLSTLAPLPPLTIAYEEWLPTVPAAAATLRPHGVGLIRCLGSDGNTELLRTRPRLPFADGTFDVITNRHEAFDAHDVRRLLRPGGAFVTQQVGRDEGASVRDLLGLAPQAGDWTLAVARAQLESAGFAIVDGAEDRLATKFTDVGALVAYIRSDPWGVPEFDPVAMRDRLIALHEICLRDGWVEAVTHRFWLTTRRPE